MAEWINTRALAHSFIKPSKNTWNVAKNPDVGGGARRYRILMPDVPTSQPRTCSQKDVGFLPPFKVTFDLHMICEASRGFYPQRPWGVASRPSSHSLASSLVLASLPSYTEQNNEGSVYSSSLEVIDFYTWAELHSAARASYRRRCTTLPRLIPSPLYPPRTLSRSVSLGLADGTPGRHPLLLSLPRRSFARGFLRFSKVRGECSPGSEIFISVYLYNKGKLKCRPSRTL